MRREAGTGAHVRLTGALLAAATTVGLLAAVSIPGAVAAVGLIVLIAGRHNRRWWSVIGLASLAAPLFVDVQERSLRALHLFSWPSFDAGVTVHVAIMVVPLLLLTMAVRTGLRWSRIFSPPESGLVGCLVAWLTLSALVGQVAHGNALGLAYYAQTVIPLLAFYVGCHHALAPRVLMRTVVITTLLVTCAILLSVAVVEGVDGPFIEATGRLAGALPQYRSYFPGVVAMAAAMAVAQRRAWRRLVLIMLGAIVALTPLMWSRAGVLVILVAGLVSAALSTGGRKQTALVVFVGIVISVGIVAVVSEQGVIGDRLDISTYEGDVRRAELAREGLSYVARSPVLGRTFEPEWDVLSGGQVTEVTRLFGSHNQFLEYGLRGGVPALLLFTAILVRTVIGAVRARADDPVHRAYHSAVAAVVIAMTIGGMFQLYFTQPYTGSLLWTLIGMSSGLRSRQSSLRHAPSDAPVQVRYRRVTLFAGSASGPAARP